MKLKFPPWYLFIPLCVIIFEIALTRFYPFSSPYFSLLFFKQPFLLSAFCLLALLRVFAAYCIFASLVDITFSKLPPFFRMGIFLGLFSATTFYAFRAFPGLKEQFHSPSKTILLLNGIAVLVLIAFYWRGTKHMRFGSFSTMSLSLLILALTRPSQWEEFKGTNSNNETNAPSFILLSFDALPGDLFNFEEKEKSVAPLWNQYWKNRGTYFTNAYSLTNSTYTSWFSLLTGKTPLESGVLSLYPHQRKGNVQKEDWLPEKLAKLGYESVFLTDCANTSFMDKEAGFNRVYQPDKGAFKSAGAIVTSTHPGLYWLTRLLPAHILMPELNSFSSHQYDPESFYEVMKREWRNLERSKSPYLLVIHSCLTHRDLAHHLPEEGTIDSASLPSFHGYRSTALIDLMKSIRTADSLIHQFLTLSSLSHKPTWKFLISDHGVRMDPKEDELTLFSHAIGDATSRFQYNVPFFVLPPQNSFLKNEPSSLISLQDLGKFVFNIASKQEKNDWLFPTHEKLTLTSAVPSDEPSHWGKTLVPLIRDGHLFEDGTFAFSKMDDERLSENRSLALLKLPYRAVRNVKLEWKVFHELKDPFHQKPLITAQPFLSQWFEVPEGSPSSVLMAN